MRTPAASPSFRRRRATCTSTVRSEASSEESARSTSVARASTRPEARISASSTRSSAPVRGSGVPSSDAVRASASRASRPAAEAPLPARAAQGGVHARHHLAGENGFTT
jgi:hypothetical protein